MIFGKAESHWFVQYAPASTSLARTSASEEQRSAETSWERPLSTHTGGTAFVGATVGEVVGDFDGFAVGDCDGLAVGDSVGAAVILQV